MSLDKTKAIKTVKLINVNGQANANKYWCCWMMPDWDLYVEYGRVGAKKPGTHTYPTNSQNEAVAKLNSLIRDKAKKGYVEASTVQEAEEELDWNALGINASEIQKSVERLTEIGRQVKPHSQITFNRSKGRFESPLGIIATTTIDKAQLVLRRVERSLSDTHSPQFSEAAEDYLKIIQIPTGMKLDVVKLLGNRIKIREQKQVLHLLCEGIKLIAATRQQILELAAELEGSGRSSWMRWGEGGELHTDGSGEVDTTDDEDSSSMDGDRSRFMSWS